MKATRLINPNADELKILGPKYSKLAAKYKRNAVLTKNTAWKKFCSSGSKPFDTARNFFTGKIVTPREIKLELLYSEI